MQSRPLTLQERLQTHEQRWSLGLAVRECLDKSVRQSVLAQAQVAAHQAVTDLLRRCQALTEDLPIQSLVEVPATHLVYPDHSNQGLELVSRISVSLELRQRGSNPPDETCNPSESQQLQSVDQVLSEALEHVRQVQQF